MVLLYFNFFNYIVLKKLFDDQKSQSVNFTYYFSLLGLIFVNVVFYRIGEHGTDRSAQILLILIYIIFIEIISEIKNKNNILLKINILILLIFLASSMKVIYYLYFIIIPIIFLYKKNLIKIFLQKYFIFGSILSVSLFLNIVTNYFNTGCLIYPMVQTCIGEPEWALPIKEVKRMSLHYEWWSKAGGGVNYASEISKEEYVKNFVWFENWLDRHFFNKVSDTLLGIIFIIINFS